MKARFLKPELMLSSLCSDLAVLAMPISARGIWAALMGLAARNSGRLSGAAGELPDATLAAAIGVSEEEFADGLDAMFRMGLIRRQRGTGLVPKSPGGVSPRSEINRRNALAGVRKRRERAAQRLGGGGFCGDGPSGAPP